MNANIVDLVLAGLLILALMYGWHWGTINVVAKVGALVLAYNAARAFSSIIAANLVKILPSLSNANEADSVAEGGKQLLAFLSLFIDTTGITNRLLGIIVFIIIFIVVNWAVRKIAYMLTGIFNKGIWGKLNRAIGAFISLVLMVAIIIIFNDIVLPVCLDLGFGAKIGDFLERSDLIMPIIKDLPSMI